MRKSGSRFLFFLCMCFAFLLFSCEQENAVKIVYKDGVDPEPAVTAYAMGTALLAKDGAGSYIEQAEEMLSDLSFSAYIDAYQAEGADTDAAIVAAVLSYLHAETTAEQNAELPDAVYYTPNGSVWHKDPSCSSLKKSQNILSATVEEAKSAGKASPCKRCAQ